MFVLDFDSTLTLTVHLDRMPVFVSLAACTDGDVQVQYRGLERETREESGREKEREAEGAPSLGQWCDTVAILTNFFLAAIQSGCSVPSCQFVCRRVCRRNHCSLAGHFAFSFLCTFLLSLPSFASLLLSSLTHALSPPPAPFLASSSSCHRPASSRHPSPLYLLHNTIPPHHLTMDETESNTPQQAIVLTIRPSSGSTFTAAIYT